MREVLEFISDNETLLDENNINIETLETNRNEWYYLFHSINNYIKLYNELIQRVYEWLVNSKEAKDYLDKVKSQIGGIIYEYNTIVPIEYIDLYWSNKGHRGCDEKRLSIRFRIMPGVNEIKTFRFKKEDELDVVVKPVTNNEKEKVICQ
jgi:hypothetical protein